MTEGITARAREIAAGLSKRAAKDLCELVEYAAGGSMSYRPRQLGLLMRLELLDSESGWPADLGRAVAAVLASEVKP